MKQGEKKSDKRALDDLFTRVKQYSSSGNYYALIRFIARFKRYSPFNAMLVHVQKPGAKYVLRASEWEKKYGRYISPSAQPLVALQPMGPVMFLFDVTDTEGAPLPPELESPFEVESGLVGQEFEQTLANCARDGIRVTSVRFGSQFAGCIKRVTHAQKKAGKSKIMFRKEVIDVSYELNLNESTSREAQYATLTHELGHLYCGHLGTDNPRWWPDRRGLDISVREFEAESISYLVCHRLGIESPSDRYLNGYLQSKDKVPPISLDRVLAASGLIENMGKKLLPTRKVL